jgi:large exoprotein involved in heme utilization and adhesion
VTITADTLRLKDSTLDTSAVLGQSELQKGGDITITARDISMKDTHVASLAFDGGGTFTIKADSLMTDFTSFETDTVFGQGGAISVEAHVVELTNGSSLISTTFGDGTAGNISLTATDHVKILGDLGTNPQAVFSPSGIFSNSFGFLGSQGNAGNVIVTTPNLEMVAGRINTVTASSGQGGNVTLNVTDSISISGEFPSDRLIVPSIFDIGPLAPSGIVTSTVGSEFCAGPCGKAGDVFINTGSLSMGAGSHVNTGTSSTGNGGLIRINASDTISMSGQLSDGSPVGVLSSSIGTEPDAGSGGNIALTAGQSVTISDRASVSASSTGPGKAGNISIGGDSLTVASGGRIEASTSGAGNGGSIAITTTGDVTVTGLSANGQVRSGIFAKTQSAGGGSGGGSGGGGGGSGGGGTATKPGSAGGITITAENLLLDGGAQIDSSTTSGGAGGTVSITTAENIIIAGSSTRLTSDATRGNGKGGNITLVAKNITVRDSASVTAATGGKGDAGNVTLTALDQLLLQSAGTVTTSTSGSGKGGTITIQAGQVLLDGPGTSIAAETLRPFADMTITINILHLNDGDLVVQLDSPTGTRVALLSRVGGTGDNFTNTSFNDQATTQITSGSAPFTGTFTPREPLGQLNNELVAGNWVLNVRDQATGNPGSLESWTLQIGTQTFQSTGGSIVIPDNGNVRSTITVANPTVPTVQGVGESAGSGGNVTINAGTVTVQNGATMSATTRGSGQGGTLTVNATGPVALTGSGSGLFTESEASGAGGNIEITASQSVTLINGATLSASSTGQIMNPGDAGSIDITATNGFTMQNSTITTQAGQGASGGNIKVTTSPEATVLLTNRSLISASVADGPGGGGNISIDPQYVILQNSQILAQAAQGQGGAITINANLFLPDATSIVNADSGSGLHGTVTIQSPNAPASGKIQPLGKTPLQATSLLNQHCAALAGGEFSSFTVAGRDSLPTEPGSWLASPFYAAGVGEGQGVRGKGLEGETALLSLRQITPAGFLTQAFAVDWSAGCQS